MAYKDQSIARAKPEVWEKLVPLFEIGRSTAQISRMSKVPPPLVALARKQWARASMAEASRERLGNQPSQPPKPTKASKAEGEERRRAGQLDRVRRMLGKKLPIKRRVDLLVELATAGESPNVRLRALEMINDLEGVNATAKNPAPPPMVPLFHLPPGTPRPSVAAGEPTREEEVTP